MDSQQITRNVPLKIKRTAVHAVYQQSQGNEKTLILKNQPVNKSISSKCQVISFTLRYHCSVNGDEPCNFRNQMAQRRSVANCQVPEVCINKSRRFMNLSYEPAIPMNKYMKVK